MKTALFNRNSVMKTLLCVFSLLCILASPAAAFWQESFESHPDDLGANSFLESAYCSKVTVSGEHGLVEKVYASGYNVNAPFTVLLPYSGYFSFSAKNVEANYVTYNLLFLDSNNNVLSGLYGLMGSSDATAWHRYEIIETPGLISVYRDGTFLNSQSYGISDTITAKIQINFAIGYTGTQHGGVYVDDLTALSCHAMIGMDSLASINDAGQYYKVAAPIVSGKSYYVELFDPENQKVYNKTLSNSELMTELLIPIANITSVGEYTLHLYRKDSVSSTTYLCMREFEVTDPGVTGEGTIEVEEDDYESGDNVKFWVHLNNYESGYKVKCEFPAGGGANFKKEIDVTSSAFSSSFSIPQISNVIGSHTVYLLNPDGSVVDSDEFNVFVPGLPDVSLDRDSYERSDTAYVYYKDADNGSLITVLLRYGGTTAQTLTYAVSGNGVLNVNLSSLSAADSMIVLLKDSDGYTNDQDNAKIVVGNFEIAGRVYDAKTKAALSNATITIQGTSINSDSNGNYNLTALAGFANYSVSKSGYTGISGTVAVFDLKTIHNFYLTQIINNGGTGIHGTIVSAKTDYALMGASVSVINNDNSKRYSTIANSAGYYELNNADLAGNLTITVSCNNYDSSVSTALVNAGSMYNFNYRLNAITGYTEINPSEHSGGSDSADPDETAAEKAYREKYGEMGKHPFDFNGDGTVENSEWKYAGERFVMLIGILAFMGFLMLINRRR